MGNKSRERRANTDGRVSVWSVLFLAAMSVSRMKKKNILTEFYEKLLVQDKSKMSALTRLDAQNPADRFDFPQEKTNVEPQLTRYLYLKIHSCSTGRKLNRKSWRRVDL